MHDSLHRSKRQGLLNLILTFFVGAFAVSTACAQFSVTGKVISSEDQSPLPGVNILVKGTNNGTITDVNGD